MPRDIESILKSVKPLAIQYHNLTGKPLGVTGEIAEFEAARLLGLKLLGARSEGYDATKRKGGRSHRIQIKGRFKQEGKKWGRVPSINIEKSFDSVMLVLMQDQYKVTEIWQATRRAVIKRLKEPGSKARNERNSMSVSQFKSIATLVWPQASVNQHPCSSATVV